MPACSVFYTGLRSWRKISTELLDYFMKAFRAVNVIGQRMAEIIQLAKPWCNDHPYCYRILWITILEIVSCTWLFSAKIFAFQVAFSGLRQSESF